MAALTPQNIVDAGTKPNFGLNTPTTSDTAPIGNGHNSFLVYKNTNASPTTLTITPVQTTDAGDLLPAHVVTIAATTGEVWVPLRKSYDNGTGNAAVTLSSATSVTVALVVMS